MCTFDFSAWTSGLPFRPLAWDRRDSRRVEGLVLLVLLVLMVLMVLLVLAGTDGSLVLGLRREVWFSDRGQSEPAVWRNVQMLLAVGGAKLCCC